MNKFYHTIYPIFWALMKVFLPWRIIGGENIPEEGGVMLCANHSSLLDPLYILCAMGRKRQLHIMAKAELFSIPVLGWLLRKAGMIPVKRGLADVSAYKESLRVLRGGERLLIFPEGTRVKEGQTVEAHTGAAVMTMRANAVLLPVFIERKKRIFRPTRLVFGEPYRPEIKGNKPTPEESRAITNDLMARIYRMGETV